LTSEWPRFLTIDNSLVFGAIMERFALAIFPKKIKHMHSAEFWVEHLNLQAHPEGGFFRETYRSNKLLAPESLSLEFLSARNVSTAIYFLLRSKDRSVFHRIKSDELWHYHAGGSLTLYVLEDKGIKQYRLGPDPRAGQQFQVVVPANHWFGAIVDAGDYVLSSCTVAPGFAFEDFEMASRDQLLDKFPEHTDTIIKLTHR
jgi:uncharacterized protein